MVHVIQILRVFRNSEFYSAHSKDMKLIAKIEVFENMKDLWLVYFQEIKVWRKNLIIWKQLNCHSKLVLIFFQLPGENANQKQL